MLVVHGSAKRRIKRFSLFLSRHAQRRFCLVSGLHGSLCLRRLQFFTWTWRSYLLCGIFLAPCSVWFLSSLSGVFFRRPSRAPAVFTCVEASFRAVFLLSAGAHSRGPLYRCANPAHPRGRLARTLSPSLLRLKGRGGSTCVTPLLAWLLWLCSSRRAPQACRFSEEGGSRSGAPLAHATPVGVLPRRRGQPARSAHRALASWRTNPELQPGGSLHAHASAAPRACWFLSFLISLPLLVPLFPARFPIRVHHAASAAGACGRL